MEENKIDETKIFVNDKEYTKEEFEQEKQRLTEKKITLVSVDSNHYKTRMED